MSAAPAYNRPIEADANASNASRSPAIADRTSSRSIVPPDRAHLRAFNEQWARGRAKGSRIRRRLRSAERLRSRRPQSFAEQALWHARDVETLRTEEAAHPLDPASERLGEGRVGRECVILEPEAEDREGGGRSLEPSVEPRDEPVAPQDGECVVAELALRRRRVHLPDVVEVEQRRGSLAGTDRVERREEGRLLD